MGSILGSFPFVPPVRYAPPVTEHVPLQSKSLSQKDKNFGSFPFLPILLPVRYAPPSCRERVSIW